MVTNVITSGDFIGQHASIFGKSITVGMFREAQHFVIDSYELLQIKKSKDHSFGTMMTGAIAGSILGPIGLLAGTVIGDNAGMPKLYCLVRINYGNKYKSEMWVEGKVYQALLNSLPNKNPPLRINIKINR